MTKKDEFRDIVLNKPEYIESILSLDKNMNAAQTLKPNNETTLDLIEYQIRSQKSLRRSFLRQRSAEPISLRQ